MKKQINILLVDNHPIFLKGLVEVIQDELPDFLIHDFIYPEKALESSLSFKYDVAILDLDMPVMNGITLSHELRKIQKDLKIIILTMHKEKEVIQSVLSSGVQGYVLKDDAVIELVIAIEEILKGNKYITEIPFDKQSSYQNEQLSKLTKTELLILKGISQNMTSRKLADELFVTTKTIENHRNNISRKLELHGSNSLLKFALNNKHLL